MTAVTDRTPALADLDAYWWTETDMAAWAGQIAAGEAARPDQPSDVLAAEWADQDRTEKEGAMTTYTPALLQALRRKATTKALWMVYAADGTVLDAIETDDGLRPPWADAAIRRGEMAQIITINVTPSEWRAWRGMAAVWPDAS